MIRFLWRGLRQAKKFNQENFRLQETIHCRCQNIVTDKEHSYEIPCPPTCKPSQERTRNQCHNNETDKKQSYEIPCPQTTTTETSQETTRYQCHNNETDEEHSYEKPCRPSNEASETNGAESSAYEKIKKKKFEGVENQKIGEEMY